MRILLVTEFFPSGKGLRFSGGVEARTFYLAKHLAQKHKITILCSLLKGQKITERIYGFSIYRVGPTRSYTATVGDIVKRILFIREAIKKGQNFDVQIVDGSNFIAHFIAKSIAQSKKIPVVAWYPDVWIGSWFKNTGLIGILGAPLEWINLKRGFDAYIAISKITAGKLQQFAKSKIYLIPCGLESQEFKFQQNKFKDPTVICVSRLAKYKHLNILLLAFAHLSTKIKNAKLIIVGTGPQSNYLKKMVHALRIFPRVRFFSNIPRKTLIKLITSSHIFSLPSQTEGFGIATIEAAYAGLPFVISNIPVNQEITRNGQGGYLVNPNDPLALSKRFYDLLTIKMLYTKKSNDAQKMASIYSWKLVANETEKVYAQLLL